MTVRTIQKFRSHCCKPFHRRDRCRTTSRLNSRTSKVDSIILHRSSHLRLPSLNHSCTSCSHRYSKSSKCSKGTYSRSSKHCSNRSRCCHRCNPGMDRLLTKNKWRSKTSHNRCQSSASKRSPTKHQESPSL